jgi:hypothetical protein
MKSYWKGMGLNLMTTDLIRGAGHGGEMDMRIQMHRWPYDDTAETGVVSL